MPAFPATESDAGGEQPEVLFRCEEGKLGAYLVLSASAEGELAGDQVVPIVLDSAPSC